MNSSKQPTINIGVLGHVSFGKSTFTRQATGTNTVIHSKEKKRGQTMNLGYANCKIYKCLKCKSPQAYQFRASEGTYVKCKHCDEKLQLEHYVSFIDCPGHNALMEIMLGGTSVMHYTLIIEDITSESIIAPQTMEHLMASEILQVPNICVCLNKIDCSKKPIVKTRIENIKKELEGTLAEKSQVIPISAAFKINLDVVAEFIAKNIKVPDIKKDDHCEMIITRSFDTNRQGPICKLVGGVAGGSIMTGKLETCDECMILPGVMRTKTEKWEYSPLTTEISKIMTGKTVLDSAIPGGLIAIQLGIDSALTAKNRLAGNIIVKGKSGLKVFQELDLKCTFMKAGIVSKELVKVREGDEITINCNSSKTIAKIVKKNKKQLHVQLLNKPIICHLDSVIAISRSLKDSGPRLIGMGIVKDGKECVLNDL
jgi:translation initiation factor 2 subunit 3